MSVQGISALERGERRSPYSDTVALLIEALGLAPNAAAELEIAAARPRRPIRRVDLGAAAYDGRSGDTNFPLQRTSLVGRESEIADVARMLRESRLVTITGAGGVGKTRVALAVGNEMAGEIEAGVWLVELAPVARGSFVIDTVALAFNVRESPSRPLLETLLSNLKQKSSLLILDNCEHVIAEVAILSDALLQRCPGLRILATSREPMRIAGERRHRLPSLRVPTRQNALGLSAAEAVRYASILLFVERAKAIDHEFTLSDNNAPIIAEICRRLDGIPLAIELAAARVNVLPPRTLLTKLDERLQLLASRDRFAPRRQQTMRALIDWSYDLLSPPEQRLFERLSVFAAGCTIETAAAVYAGDSIDEVGVLDLLELLIDKSLVVADVGGPEPRYELLESSRQYAYEKLTGRGEATAVAHRHALVYLELAARFERESQISADLPVILHEAKVELDNWRTALDWSLDRGNDLGLGQSIAVALRRVWAEYTISEGRRWLRLALDLVDSRTPLDLVARIESAEAELALRAGELQAALESVDRALPIYEKLGDVRGATTSRGLAGLVRSRLGRPEEAEPLLRDALEAARTLGDRRITGQILRNTAHARSVAGRLDDARALYGQALAIFTELGLPSDAAAVTVDLAEAEFRAGNAQSAAQIAGDALAKSHERKQANMISVALRHNLAAYLVALARYEEARARAREALDLARELQIVAVVAWTIQHLAAVAALRPSATDESRSLDRLKAARLLGFVLGHFAALGTPQEYTEQQECDKLAAALRGRFDAPRLAQLMAEGAAMSEELAIELALSI